MKLVAEAIARISGASSERASALNHELRNHAMENKAIVKRTLHFCPVLGSLNSLVPSARPTKLPTVCGASFSKSFTTMLPCDVSNTAYVPGARLKTTSHEGQNMLALLPIPGA